MKSEIDDVESQKPVDENDKEVNEFDQRRVSTKRETLGKPPVNELDFDEEIAAPNNNSNSIWCRPTYMISHEITD